MDLNQEQVERALSCGTRVHEGKSKFKILPAQGFVVDRRMLRRRSRHVDRHRASKKRVMPMEERTIRCYKCKVLMDVVRMDYEARGVLIKDAEGLCCPRCGLEAFTSAQLDTIEKIVYSLVPRLKLVRKISSAAGKKPVLYLPPELLSAVDGKIGDRVELSVVGPGRFTVELATAEDIEIEASDFPVKKSPARVVAPA